MQRLPTTATPEPTVKVSLRFYNQDRAAVDQFAQMTRERFQGVFVVRVVPVSRRHLDVQHYDPRRSWCMELTVAASTRLLIEADGDYAEFYRRAVCPPAGGNRVFVDGRLRHTAPATRVTQPSVPPPPAVSDASQESPLVDVEESQEEDAFERPR